MSITARLATVFFTVVVLFASFVPFASAQTPTFTPTPTPITAATPTPSGSGTTDPYPPGEPSWGIDYTVTQVGRNAERARQFVYWVFSNSMIYDTPVVRQIYAVTRNISLLLIAFVIIGLAIHLVLSKKNIGPTFSGISIGYDKVSISTIIFRVAALILFVLFSYYILLGLIQGAEIISRFFIETIAGNDLFNIVFSGGNVEENYNFIGYRNFDPLEQDMASTSLFLVKFTSFTYNFLSVILILRQIILLFLLILSPFLALLLPFIFIRNTGYIWIGEFLRWLFYGPLVALFIAALTQIWKAGIPFGFNFGRAREGEMVYNTAINILYGGPAQALSPTNTSNYVDTYAEYVIALIMLWAAIILPWFLLRIFRDYCCDILEKNQGVLIQMLDKLRTLTPPKPPSGPSPAPTPTGTFGKSMHVTTKESDTAVHTITREQIIEKIHENQIEKVQTQDLKHALDLTVTSLRDIARYDTRKSERTAIEQTLNRIQNPYKAANPAEQKQYEKLRNEFTQRASQGDTEARKVIQAITPLASQLEMKTADVPHDVLRKAVEKPGVPVSVSSPHAQASQQSYQEKVRQVSQNTSLSQEQVQTVLKKAHDLKNTVNKDRAVQMIAEAENIEEEKVQDVLNAIPSEETPQSTITSSPVSIEEYEEIKGMWINHYRKSDVPVSEQIKDRNEWLSEDIKSLTNTLNLLTSPAQKDKQQGLSQVAELLPFLLLGGFTDLETLTYIKAKLEAAKLVRDEIETIEQVKEKVKSEDEELYVIPTVESAEKLKEKQEQTAQELPLPEEAVQSKQQAEVNPSVQSSDSQSTATDFTNDNTNKNNDL